MGGIITLNNKFLSFLSILLIIFTGSILIISHDYQSKVNNAEKSFDISSKFTPFNVPVEMNSDKKYNEVISSVNSTAKELNLNYLKRVRYSGYLKSNGKLNYSKPIQSVVFQTYTTHPTSLWENFGLKPKIVSKKSDNFNNGLSQYSVHIAPISFSEKYPQNREGTFFLETKKAKKFSEFRKILSKKLSAINKTKISSDDLLINDSDSIPSISFDSPERLNDVFQTSLLFLFLFVVIFIISNSKSFSIYKLNGFTTFKIIKISMGKIFIFSALGLSVVDGLAYYVFNLNIDQIIIIKELLMMIIFYIISTILVSFFQYFNFSNQINGKNYNRLNFIALYLAKGVSITICLFTLVPLAEVSISSYISINHPNQYDRQKDFGVFYPVITGNNPNEFSLEQGKVLDDNMYSYLNSRGAIIYDDSYLKQPIADYLKFIKVNPNYLNKFPLYDTSGYSIHLDNNSRDVLLAIPVSKAKSTKALVSDIKQISKEEIGRIPKIKIVYISNRYNNRFKSINNGENISKYVVFVTTKNNSSFVERNIMDGGGFSDGLKMSIGSSVESTYNRVKKRLIQYNYYDNYPQLIKLSDYYHEDLLISIGDVISQSLTVLVGFIITLILVIYVAFLYFKNFKRSIFIKKLNGYSNMKAYLYFWILMAMQYLLIALIMYLNDLFSMITVMTVSIVLIIELLISLCVVKKLNSGSWGDVINEQ